MSAARWGYRRLVKSAAVTFSKDQFAFVSAKKELRIEFLKNKDVSDPVDLAGLLRGIDEIDEMLRFNVVQGVLNENGNYGESSKASSIDYPKYVIFIFFFYLLLSLSLLLL